MKLRIGKLQIFLTGPLIVVGCVSILLISILSMNQARSVLKQMGQEVALESLDYISLYVKDIDTEVSKVLNYTIPNYKELVGVSSSEKKKQLLRFFYFLKRDLKFVRSLYIIYPEGGGIGVSYDQRLHSYFAFFTETRKPSRLYKFKISNQGELSGPVQIIENFDFKTRPRYKSLNFDAKKLGGPKFIDLLTQSLLQ